MKVTEQYLKQLIRESIEEMTNNPVNEAEGQYSYKGDPSELEAAMDAIAVVKKALLRISDSDIYRSEKKKNLFKNADQIEMLFSDVIDSIKGASAD